MKIARRLASAMLLASLLMVVACHKASSPESAKPEDSADAKEPTEKAAVGVSLSAEQIEKIGLKIAAANPMSHADETVGFGTVVTHESIAQAVAELATAEATERESRAALARTQRLAGTLGAVSADIEATTVRQAAVDSAALNLAKQKLSATFGPKAPWSGGGNHSLLLALANGTTQLVRVTFPLGSLPGNVPENLSAARIGAAANAKRWKLTTVWSAPADASVPGRSFFAVLRSDDAGEGERIVAWAPVGVAREGVFIPGDAVVVSEGKYWCYQEEKVGHFVRTEVTTDTPVDDGYFVMGAVHPGDNIVTEGAEQLLAQESNSGAAAE